MSAYYSRANSYSRSYNAHVAESQKRMPLTRAARAVAAANGCPVAVAKVALSMIHDGEWHHVGKFANRVDYYDTTDERLPGIIHHVMSCGGAKRFEARRSQCRIDRRYGGKSCAYVYAPKPGRFLAMLARKRLAVTP